MQAALTALCFSLLGVFARWGYAGGLSVGELLTYRFICAALILWAGLLTLKRKWIFLSRRQVAVFAVLGVFGYASMSTTYFMAIQGLNLTMAVLLLYTYPFWVSLFAHIFTEHKLNRRDLLSLVIAAFGLVLLVGGHVEVRAVAAVALGLASAITYALYIIFSAKLQKSAHPLASSTYVITFGAIALYLIYRPSLAHVADLPALQLWNIVGVAVACTVLPLTLELAALQKIKGTEFSMIMMFEPIAASLWGFLLFDEVLAPTQMLGALIIIGTLVAKLFLGRPQAAH